MGNRVYGVNHGRGELELHGRVVLSGPEEESAVPDWVIVAFENDLTLMLVVAEYDNTWTTWHRPEVRR